MNRFINTAKIFTRIFSTHVAKPEKNNLKRNLFLGVTGLSGGFAVYATRGYDHEKYYCKEMTGKEFNKIFGSKKLLKFTTMYENHNGFQFRDGLNEDTEAFFPHGECNAGGIYFTEKEQMHIWLGSWYHWVRDVTIPDDARVYVEREKFKADKLILSKASAFDDDEEVKNVLQIAKKLRFSYEKECEAIIRKNGLFLDCVSNDNKSFTLDVLAVRQNKEAIIYVCGPPLYPFVVKLVAATGLIS